MNCEGRITVRAERCGGATAVADIVRAVEAAQARAAPVQRLADIVAGRFAVGVLGLSAATFGFWALAAPRLMPQVRAYWFAVTLFNQLMPLPSNVELVNLHFPCHGRSCCTCLLPVPFFPRCSTAFWVN